MASPHPISPGISLERSESTGSDNEEPHLLQEHVTANIPGDTTANIPGNVFNSRERLLVPAGGVAMGTTGMAAQGKLQVTPLDPSAATS